MRLNDYQRQILFRASSKNIENRNLSPLALARKIDAVVAKLHQENPTAFVTSVQDGVDGEVSFKGIDSLLKERNFYNQPTTLNMYTYNSFVKPVKSYL